MVAVYLENFIPSSEISADQTSLISSQSAAQLSAALKLMMRFKTINDRPASNHMIIMVSYVVLMSDGESVSIWENDALFPHDNHQTYGHLRRVFTTFCNYLRGTAVTLLAVRK